MSDIIIDDEHHPRAEVDQQLVTEYAEAMKAGAEFPPIVVFRHGKKFLLADGRHRYEAAKLLTRKTIKAKVHDGDKRDAILFAVGANAQHGQRRTGADKRKAVTILLTDKTWCGWSDSVIAKHCRVSRDLVKDVRAEVRPPHLAESQDSSTTTAMRNGKAYKIRTGDIGKASRTLSAKSAQTVNSMLKLTSDAREYLEAEEKPELAKQLDPIAAQLQDILGQATGASYRMAEHLAQPLNVYERPRKDGVKRNPEFDKKGLCNYSVGVGIICGHQCTYCSSPSLLRTHEVFKEIGQTAFQRGFAIIDPASAKRIKERMPRNLTADDVIQLSTIDDAWSPEARRNDLGRKVMQVLLEETPAQIRVLTKSAEVAKDFKLFAKYPDRVMVGLSTGIPPDRDDVTKVVEPNASSTRERLAALKKAHAMGLRTYGMLCPCLPGVADSVAALRELFDAVLACGVEDIWTEPVNRRGRAVVNTVEALHRAGLQQEADAVEHIRNEGNWSAYTLKFVQNVIKVAAGKKVLDKLHILLYASNLTEEHKAELKKYQQGIVWLESEEKRP
ncbi:MAG: ParB N-terminal domain-containing protein [Kiritimatiellaeota bacterium]|nr:ParB N-terminal domain-containing protein [Kiritimatiellota bacterium]